MFPCIMCLQNFDKKKELEEFMDSNNIYLEAIPEKVNLLGMFHTVLHTEENGLKIVIYQQSVQFLHKLYRMCSVTDGCRVKQIMTTIEEILNQRYVILQLFKKYDNREKINYNVSLCGARLIL